MKKLKTTNSPSVILKLKNIKPNSKITLFNIAHCIKLKWTLSQGLLAEMGGTSERTINRCLAELEEQGYIKRETKLFNGKGKETKYTIIWDNVTRYAKDYEWYEDNKTIENNQPIEVVNIESSITEQAENEFMEDLNNTTETEETTENMGTFIGYIETPIQEFEPDNYSDYLHKVLDDYKEVINHTTEAIAKAETSDDIVVVYQAKQAKTKLKEISEKLIEEIDKSNFNKFIMERVEIKKKYIAA